LQFRKRSSHGAVLIVGVLLLSGAAGCGSSQRIDTTASFSLGPLAKETTEIALLETCVDTAGARLATNPPQGSKGRIAINAAGFLPAKYLAAVVWPNGAYSDVWLGEDASAAATTADKLNTAQAQTTGVPSVRAAFVYGSAVSAPGDPEKLAELPQMERSRELPEGSFKKVNECLAAINAPTNG
jgi:hypothetical protein